MATRDSSTSEVASTTDAVTPGQARALQTLQRQIEGLYRLPPAPEIAPFVRQQRTGQREEVLVRTTSDALDILVLLPQASLDAVQTYLGDEDRQVCWDAYLEALEGVSHFVLLVQRASAHRTTTLLELELQAEVDKLAVLANGLDILGQRVEASSRRSTLLHLHERLYEQVHFLFPKDSVLGARYRYANDLAARLWYALLQQDAPPPIEALRRFYRASQEEKIRIANAA